MKYSGLNFGFFKHLLTSPFCDECPNSLTGKIKMAYWLSCHFLNDPKGITVLTAGLNSANLYYLLKNSGRVSCTCGLYY